MKGRALGQVGGMLMLTVFLALPKAGFAAETLGEPAAEKGRSQLAAFPGESGLKHYYIHRPNGNLDIVQRVDPAGTASFTTVSFSPLNGPGLFFTVDGSSREVSMLTTHGLVTLKPASPQSWLLCFSQVPNPPAMAQAAAFECHLVHGESGDGWPKGALTSVVDLKALRAFAAFASQENLTPAPSFGAQPGGFWDCMAAVLAGAAASVQMAIECGTPGLNVLTCGAAVAAYTAALIAITEACDAATW